MSTKIHEMLRETNVIPVLAFTEVDETLKIIGNMISGGVTVIELTMRSPVALQTLERAKAEFGDHATLGMGTIMNAQQLKDVRAAGADFGVSPGLTPSLRDAIVDSDLPFLPGVANVSQAMGAQDAGFYFQKFFPAEQAGGAPYLKSIGAVLPDVTFCPTGGVNTKNAPDYLSLTNVGCVGTSALTALAKPDGWDLGAFQAQVAAHLPA